ncbi:hypothetical protein NGTWS0302_26620 [Mycolicibacterium cyprinidarum]|uniref:Twin-arginine translocation pathway signal n=1 Tax=Mycolicibacterium cyprinidarum TaxID=2860311 RepID=A0ABQ4VBH5_9MYCO|nr:hypothetical protein NGTWS1803_12620 [Mycolicibacterium sp. NGTWS1803]GJF10575.1 hypothetical protein NGTWS0302_26620 [Mycolicibacterium sp. NGTWS0302]GJF17968.1 hypothetical protein NGTWS1702_25200 [Mycolicibacterium sp. NGTWSNA01]
MSNEATPTEPDDVSDVTDTDATHDAPTPDEGSSEAASEEAVHDDSVAKRSPRGIRAMVGIILLAGALIASAGMAGWLYLYQYRPDQQTNAAAAKVALDAASSGTIALLSYAPDSLDQDFTAAKSRLTGDFLSYYTQFTEQIVTPAAREKSVKTEASVVRAAVSKIQPDSAEVLVFINQTTTSKENPDGAFAASAVKVGMKKVDGAWLIASFDPV